MKTDSMKTANAKADFDQRYQTHLKHLKLKGLQPKTIDAYARAIRRMGDYFEHRIDNLSAAQLTDYFSDLIVNVRCPPSLRRSPRFAILVDFNDEEDHERSGPDAHRALSPKH